eukprot:9323664-Lingulodinium_polyedra.AAC.1
MAPRLPSGASSRLPSPPFEPSRGTSCSSRTASTCETESRGCVTAPTPRSGGTRTSGRSYGAAPWHAPCG